MNKLYNNENSLQFYEITNRCSYVQSILFHCQVHSTCFWCFIHPSSGVQFLALDRVKNCTLDDRCIKHRNMQSEPSSGIYLSEYISICWLFLSLYYNARNHKNKKNLVAIPKYVLKPMLVHCIIFRLYVCDLRMAHSGRNMSST